MRVVQPFFHRLADGTGTPGSTDCFLPFQGGTLPKVFFKPLYPHISGFNIKRLAKICYGFRPPLRIARSLQELVDKPLVVAMILYPAAVSALVLALHR